MMHPIVWKEWREQRWKLAFGTVMLLFFTGTLLAARVTSTRESVLILWCFGGLILALYSAMGVLAPEQTNETLSFLAAKPAQSRTVFLTKWLFGWLNIVVPMIAAMAALLLVNRQILHDEGGWNRDVAKVLLGGLGFSTMFYTFTCCLAPRKTGEAGVGLVGLVVILALLLHMYIIDSSYKITDTMGAILMSANPMCWSVLIDNTGASRSSLIICMVGQLLSFVAVMEYGHHKFCRSV